jgi:molybdopterin-guanine dinucleotide biosynthesis protein B
MEGLVMQVVGYKKTGKTSLVCRLAERYAAQGLRVGTVKHDGHEFEPDVPGTDSWKHRQAGAALTAIVSPARTAFFTERTSELDAVLARMADGGAQVVLVEGWKRERYPKLALVQTEEQLEVLAELSALTAVATWNVSLRERISSLVGVPVLDYEDTDGIAALFSNQV